MDQAAEYLALGEDAPCIGTDMFVTGKQARDTKRICRPCPKVNDCLAIALQNGEEYGIWGGLTERERRALLRRFPLIKRWDLLLQDLSQPREPAA